MRFWSGLCISGRPQFGAVAFAAAIGVLCASPPARADSSAQPFGIVAASDALGVATSTVDVYTGVTLTTYPYTGFAQKIGTSPQTLRPDRTVLDSEPFVVARASGNVYVENAFETGGVVRYGPGGSSRTLVAPRHCSSTPFMQHGALALSLDEKTIYVPDCNPKTGAPVMVFGYTLGSKTPKIAYSAPPTTGYAAGVAVDGNGLLWIAWDGGLAPELSAYSPPSLKPVLSIKNAQFGSNFNDLVVDRAGALWALQNAQTIPLGDDEFRYFTHGTCVVDNHVPHDPKDDFRSLLARKFVKGELVAELYSSANTSVGDGDGDIFSFAAAADGHAFVGFDIGYSSASTDIAGVDVFDKQSGVICPTAVLPLPGRSFPALDTDAKSNIYVGSASIKSLLIYSPGARSRLATYGSSYSPYLNPGYLWVR